MRNLSPQLEETSLSYECGQENCLAHGDPRWAPRVEKQSGIAKRAEFALGMGLNNITVALAWFGVNLLQVGLHSYGFDDGVARNLFIFIAVELVICFGLYFWPRLKTKPKVT